MTSETVPIGRWCAAAVMVTPDGRYLMQQRDWKPEIILPGHWALFGGSVDPGESAEAAIARELREELEFATSRAKLFTELTIDLAMRATRRDRMTFFEVPIAADDPGRMIQHEGAGMALFTPEALAAEQRVAPWDLAVVLMHARRPALFGDR